jgi:hypothetical protein
LWAIIRYGCASSQLGNVLVENREWTSAERGLEALVLQVGVVAEQLRGGEHPLVDDRARAEARHHEVGPRRDLRHAPDHVELALERILVARELVRGRHDELLDVGGEEVGRDADVVLVDGHVAPADDALALPGHRALEQRLQLGTAVLLRREEADADAVSARWREVLVEHGAHERVGHLEQDPGAVAGVRVSTRRPAMLEVLQRHHRAPDRLVRRLAVEPRDEGDAAGVVLVAWVVKANRLGRPRHA